VASELELNLNTELASNWSTTNTRRFSFQDFVSFIKIKDMQDKFIVLEENNRYIWIRCLLVIYFDLALADS